MPARRPTTLQTIRALRRNPLELWGEAAFREPVLTGRLLGRQRIMLNSPAAIRHVLLDAHENYVRSPITRRVLRPILGDGLLLAEGGSWTLQRRTIAPAFSPRVMPMLCGHIATAAEQAVAALAAGGPQTLDLHGFLRQVTLTIAGRSMFSLEMDAFGERLRRLMHRYAEQHAPVRMLDMLLPPRLPSPADLGRRRFEALWRRFMDEVIAAREASPGEERDLFDILRAARDPDTGQGFSRDQLRDEISTLILAGHETTAVALFWSCYLAVLFPEQQDRIAREAAGVDLSPGNAAAAVAQLPQTRAHLEETMRLYPPAYLIVRMARAADSLPGVETRVEPGALISMAPWVLHRHRTLWTDPEAFDPARFLPGAPAPDRFAYMPFGAGPRICVGARFALAEGVLVLARLLREVRLAFEGDGAVLPLGRVTTQPDRAVGFRVVGRG
jgi:unspecific monooxygenase